MRLIDADRLIDILKQEEEHHSDSPQRADGIRDAIMDVFLAPTVDAVKVVRCGSCKHSDWGRWAYCYCTKHGSGGYVADDFCSYGELEDVEQDETN